MIFVDKKNRIAILENRIRSMCIEKQSEKLETVQKGGGGLHSTFEPVRIVTQVFVIWGKGGSR